MLKILSKNNDAEYLKKLDYMEKHKAHHNVDKMGGDILNE